MLNKRSINKFAKSSCALRNRHLFKWQVGFTFLPAFHFFCHFITLLFTDCPFCQQQSYHQGLPTEFHYLLPTPRYLTDVSLSEQSVARVYSLWNIGIPVTGVRRGQPAGRRRITRQTEFVPNLQPLSLFFTVFYPCRTTNFFTPTTTHSLAPFPASRPYCVCSAVSNKEGRRQGRNEKGA